MAKKNKVGIVAAMDRKCPGWRIMPEDWREEATKLKEQCCNDGESGLTLLQSRWEAGIGTYAARQFLHRDPEKRYKHFEWCIDRQFKTDKELPLTKKAELYFSRPTRPDPLIGEGEPYTKDKDDKGREVDVESFLRSYRRWRKG